MRLIVASLVAFVALAVVITPALAANPTGTGQPNQSCEDQAVRATRLQLGRLCERRGAGRVGRSGVTAAL